MIRRLRMATGLVLFAYVTTHLVNHSLGIVSVAASNNGITYSGTIDFQIAITDFAIGVSPDNASVSAGQSSRHVVTVAPQAGAYNSAVTLSCSSSNLPPQTTCVFDPPTVTEGSTVLHF